MRLPRLVRTTRRLGRTRLGARGAETLYRGVAEGAARLIVRLPQVVSVYLRGSLAVPGSLKAGYSDIDILPIVDVPTLEDELRFRDGLARVMRLLNLGGPLFKNIDYLDRRDLDLYRTGGDIFSLDWDRRWLHLAGPDVRPPAGTPPADAGHRRLERVARAVRRWTKASSFLLDEGAGRDEHIVRIGTERLLGDGVAALLDRERLLPLPLLLKEASARPLPAGALAEITHLSLRHGAPPESVSTTEMVAGALEAIELAIHEATSAWPVGPGPGTSEPRGTFEIASRRLLARGYVTAVLGERSPTDRVLFVIEPRGRTAREAISRHSALLAEAGALSEADFPWARRPVLVTERLLRGAFLFEPRLDRTDALTVHGAALPELPLVPDAVWLRHSRAERIATVVRARGRRFRAHRTADAALGALARDIERLDEAAGLRRDTPLPRSERELLQAVREHLALLRHLARA